MSLEGQGEQTTRDSPASKADIPTNGQPPLSLPSFPEVRINGLKVPGILDVEWIKQMKDMKLRPDDVWVVTYPKCGTTWTQQIVRLIINRGKDDDRIIEDAVPWVEAFCNIPEIGRNYRIDVDKMASPRAFKSHFPYEMMPCGLPNTTPGKYIYVVRNPKDVVVSYYHHDRAIPIYPLYEWDEYFELFMKGGVDFGDYFDHVLSWWAHKDDDNVLFLKYEDMKRDLPTAVAQIAKFIGQDISKELVEEIAHKTTFANMRKDSTANYEWVKKIRRPSSTNFMRKGEVGDWKNYFTAEQSARLDAVVEEKMNGAGIDFDYH